MKNAWFEAFPEMKQYLKECQEGIVYTLTGRARGDTTYCAVANTPFQGLASDGLKLSLYALFKMGYKIIAEIHDAIMIEVPEKDSEEQQKIIEAVMISEMKRVVPDVKIGVEGKITKRWEK
jgi:DNA polymerase I-like protein with 3'-5' exonuclease and polymerase domains